MPIFNTQNVCVIATILGNKTNTHFVKNFYIIDQVLIMAQFYNINEQIELITLIIFLIPKYIAIHYLLKAIPKLLTLHIDCILKYIWFKSKTWHLSVPLY